jgi:uncharacterized protein YbjT (DUF2867 family)
MKHVVTGAAGHVSKPLTELLLKKGHHVTVVGRNPKNLEGLVKLGARTAIGDMADVPFLTETFEGADGVYLMLPPMWDSQDQKKQSVQYAENFSTAIRANGVKNVVFLSSYGAHRLDDAGAISGCGRAEVVLNKLDGVNVLSLRAGYFYSNLLLSLDLVRSAGHLGNMFTIPDGTFTVVDPVDIAQAAADALDTLNFKGHSSAYVISDLTGTDEIAALIGKEIGILNLKWVKFPAADFKKVLLSFGFADGAANDYVELFATLDSGLLFEDIQKTKPKIHGTRIEEFAKTWAAAYRQGRVGLDPEGGTSSTQEATGLKRGAPSISAPG